MLEGGSSVGHRRFPARIEAARRAELSFAISGRLQEILVKEGDPVREGQTLARLDPTDYKIVLKDRQASYDNAKRNFDRASELVKTGAISRIDFDRTESNLGSDRQTDDPECS